MEFGVTSKALEIIEDHDIRLALLRIEIAQQGHHAGTLHEVAAAGDIIGKDSLDSVAFLGGILTAAGFLAFEPVALRGLLGT
ncbi:hypothetical protein So717_17220 [Roseobacter cerasinus]|uniref:Uncharacterized protein n=1 Tax=Roseobacter cerasinus TaxID=2602289 RepID=A0A640VPM6_9RHOB|nr:hypothetical protein So717_17220 [Roseobacter cerasinus]